MNHIQKYLAPAVAALGITFGLLQFVEKEEGFGPKNSQGLYMAYADPGYGWKLPTICSGHTRGVKRGDTATKEQCRAFLKEDLEVASKGVAKCVKVPITQGQFDALTSFNFNTGSVCIAELTRKLNAGKCYEAAREFNASPRVDKYGNWILYNGKVTYKWTTSNGIPLRGLMKRRTEEREMFEEGCGDV